jgi:hypothetical protein
MKQLNNSFTVSPKKWQLLPYLLFGLLLFAVNSSFNLNYFARGYLTILEIQVGIVILYFWLAKQKKLTKNK